MVVTKGVQGISHVLSLTSSAKAHTHRLLISTHFSMFGSHNTNTSINFKSREYADPLAISSFVH